jgi:hypothetical protein
MWNKSPAHQREGANGFLWMLTNDGDRLGRRDVVSWIPVVLPLGSVKVLLDNLFSTRQSVAPAHWEALWQIGYALRSG